jgi:selenocysteine lyase/cysteine desulfurase
MLLGEKILPKTILEGGNGINSLDWEMPDFPPERFETGTLPTPCIAGLSEGISYLSKFTPEEIATHELSRFDRLKYMLMNSPELSAKIYLPESRGAVMLFNMDVISSENVGRFLSERGICVRSGYHCAALGHKALGTEEIGAVRVSFGAFNTESEVLYFKRICKKLLNQ